MPEVKLTKPVWKQFRSPVYFCVCFYLLTQLGTQSTVSCLCATRHVSTQRGMSLRNTACLYATRHVSTQRGMSLRNAACLYATRHVSTQRRMSLHNAACLYTMRHVSTQCGMSLHNAACLYTTRHVSTQRGMSLHNAAAVCSNRGVLLLFLPDFLHVRVCMPGLTLGPRLAYGSLFVTESC